MKTYLAFSSIRLRIFFLFFLVEQRIAKFHQREDAISYISCFDANAGIFETLLKEQDYVISVSENYFSFNGNDLFACFIFILRTN